MEATSHPFASRVISIAVEAGQMAARIQRELVEPALEKDDRSPVTVADFAVQALIAARLEEAFPGQPLVAEESADQLASPAGCAQLESVARFLKPELGVCDPDQVRHWIDRGTAAPSDRCWVLDPIDGTRGFLRNAHYAVALALMENGVVTLGVLACPRLSCKTPGPEPTDEGSLFLAVRGNGCWIGPLSGGGEFTRLQVSDCTDPAEARVLRSVEKAHTNLSQTDQTLEALGSRVPSVGMDSQAKYGLLAAGGGEILLRLISSRAPDYRENIWDQAAGSIVVEEAGGVVTDLAGRPLDFSTGRTLTRNRGVVVSNGHVHDAVLAALKQVGADGSRLSPEG